MGFGEDNWGQVRKDLVDELYMNDAIYMNIHKVRDTLDKLEMRITCSVTPAPYENWMSFPNMGHFIAFKYDIVIVLLSYLQCLTFLPLSSDPVPKGKKQEHGIALVDENHVHLVLKKNCPIPHVADHWRRYHHPGASAWKIVHMESKIIAFRDGGSVDGGASCGEAVDCGASGDEAVGGGAFDGGVVADGGAVGVLSANKAAIPSNQWRSHPLARQKSPCQPHNHDFPLTIFGNQDRRFNKVWFSGHSNWLEYSVSKDAAYCLCCYLFKPDIGGQLGGDHFVTEGFKNWKRNDKLSIHVEGPNSAHNIAWGKCQDLMNQKQHIETVVCKQSNQEKARYKIRLNTSIEVARYLSTQGLAFRGHDEIESSTNPGNFIQLVKLSISKLRGQGYDGAMLNVVGSSCKRRDLLREKQSEKILEALDMGEISTGRGLNQETNLKRAGCDTRWSSHYNTLLSLINMFGAVIDVLELIGRDASILAITNELSQALQRKDQDIVNAMTLVQVSKIQIQSSKESGWSYLLDGVTTFCEKHGVDIPQMDAKYVARGRRRQNEEEMTNLHHYKIETFYTVLDMQLGELNARFSDSTMELLMCVSCLDPSNSFSHYSEEKLLRLVDFYPEDFTEFDKCKLSDQLDNYIVDMRLSKDFLGLNGISDLARIMVETRRNKVYPLVYLLLTLALTLPVATATVEKAFSAINIIKNGLHNRMND
ncbi:PREDICTED: uncharacterized protein LOC105964581 [Erythranthe guttata]|uniref:uncharacterized protein LOC105964581 n=1 Tax=Erythranthe guttata TaxID=4155 RepID=UPI00064DF764|nr:PREDICTED: uncharacterized protein LOC105964581 [Erythranthe guttata]|eukprot:XP_012844543.1 PREDICTED: uncharacterized protein LOC105964581 [Erythranthe guttata]